MGTSTACRVEAAVSVDTLCTASCSESTISKSVELHEPQQVTKTRANVDEPQPAALAAHDGVAADNRTETAAVETGHPFEIEGDVQMTSLHLAGDCVLQDSRMLARGDPPRWAENQHAANDSFSNPHRDAPRP